MGGHQLKYLKFHGDTFRPFMLFPFQTSGPMSSFLIGALHFMFLALNVLRVTGESLNFVLHLGDREKMVNMIPLNAVSMLCFTRLLLVLKKDQFLLLFTNLDEIFDQSVKFGKNPDTVHGALRTVKRACVGYIISGIVIFFHWLLNPILRNLLHPSEKWVKDHPANVWYPFPYDESPAYEILYVTLGIGTAFSAFVLMLSDTFIGSLCYYMCFLLSELRKRLRALEENTKRISTVSKLDVVYWKKVDEDLLNCINHHGAIIRYVKQFEDFFSYIFATTFVIEAMSLCFIAIEASSAKLSTTTILNWMEIMVVLSLQLLFFFWCGNVVTQEGLGVHTAATESWSESTPDHIKWKLRIIMLRSQTPISIKGGKIITLNMETFKGLIGFCISCFLLVRKLKMNADQ